MKRVIVCAVMTALLLSALVSAGAEPIQLRHKFIKGEVDNYKLSMKMKMNMPMMPTAETPTFSVSATWSQKTLEVAQDGSAKVEITYKDFSVSGMGQNAPKPPIEGVSVIVYMTAEGAVCGIEGMDAMMPQGMDMSGMFSQLGQYSVFPSQALSVGQSWAQSIPIPMFGGDLKQASTLLSLDEQVYSRRAAKIKSTYAGYIDLKQMMSNFAQAMGGNNPQATQMMTGLDGGLDISGWAVTYFSPEMGKLLKLNANVGIGMQMRMPPEAVQQGAPTNLDFNMTMDINVARTS